MDPENIAALRGAPQALLELFTTDPNYSRYVAAETSAFIAEELSRRALEERRRDVIGDGES